jgi:hypothetical protein
MTMVLACAPHHKNQQPDAIDRVSTPSFQNLRLMDETDCAL